MSGNIRRAGRQKPGYSRKAEKEAQARSKVPTDISGCDYIARKSIDWNKYRDNYDNIFRKKETPDGE